MGVTYMARQEDGQRNANTPHKSDLKDTVILSEKHGHSHTAAAKKREDKRPQHFSNKSFHVFINYLFLKK